MRKIVVYELLSLDGVAEAPDKFFEWDDAVGRRLAATIETQDAVVFGRRTYDRVGAVLAEQRDRAIRDIHQRRHEVRRDIDAARPESGPTRRRSTAAWSNSFGISSNSLVATSACTPVSR